MRQIFHKNFTTKIYNQKLKNHTCVNPNVNPKKYHICREYIYRVLILILNLILYIRLTSSNK